MSGKEITSSLFPPQETVGGRPEAGGYGLEAVDTSTLTTLGLQPPAYPLLYLPPVGRMSAGECHANKPGPGGIYTMTVLR